MATQATARKVPAKKTAARKAAPKKPAGASVKQSAQKVVNIYLGVIGKGLDSVKDSIESTRKENDKRMKELEARGAKFRKELSKRFEKLDVVEDTKAQFGKIQDQADEAVDSVKEKLRYNKAA